MSLLEKYLEGWGFRTSKPSFDVGDELSVFVTGERDGTQVARVGDTVLRLPDAPEGLVDKRVLVRVTSFDDNDHAGDATYVETVGESSF